MGVKERRRVHVHACPKDGAMGHQGPHEPWKHMLSNARHPHYRNALSKMGVIFLFFFFLS